MAEVTERVSKRTDAWVDVPAEPADGSGFTVPPIQLRPGSVDDTLRISEVPTIGAEIRISDLRNGIDLIEKDAQR